MTANLAVASQSFAQQIAKNAGLVKTNQEGNLNQHGIQRKADLENIFGATKLQTKTAVKEPAVVEPVATNENASIFSTPVAQSQFKAAQVAKKADIANYDAATVGAKFGGIA